MFRRDLALNREHTANSKLTTVASYTGRKRAIAKTTALDERHTINLRKGKAGEASSLPCSAPLFSTSTHQAYLLFGPAGSSVNSCLSTGLGPFFSRKPPAKSPESKPSWGAGTPSSRAETALKNDTEAGRAVGDRIIPRTAASAPLDTKDRQTWKRQVGARGGSCWRCSCYPVLTP